MGGCLSVSAVVLCGLVMSCLDVARLAADLQVETEQFISNGNI